MKKLAVGELVSLLPWHNFMCRVCNKISTFYRRVEKSTAWLYRISFYLEMPIYDASDSHDTGSLKKACGIFSAWIFGRLSATLQIKGTPCCSHNKRSVLRTISGDINYEMVQPVSPPLMKFSPSNPAFGLNVCCLNASAATERWRNHETCRRKTNYSFLKEKAWVSFHERFILPQVLGVPALAHAF